MKIIIKEQERGIWFRDGNYKGVLKPGRHFLLPFFDNKVEILDVTQVFYLQNYDLELFLSDEELCRELSVVDVADRQIAIHFIDGKFRGVLGTGKYAFWNVLKQHRFEMIDTSQPKIDASIDRSLLARPQFRGYSVLHDVEPHMKGVLFFDNQLQRILEPGRHYFWTGAAKVEVVKVDMRAREIEINGQEIMTEDKVPLRFNFVCQYRIADAEKSVLEVKDYEQQIYLQLQMVLREYVGTLKLDELLKLKQEIADYVLHKMKGKEDDYGAKFLFAGVKDIILPGEIKAILNTVLVAEKKALANVITRREETASTRSLLNTAKLMDENQTLYRLKELEFLEKICDKVGNISLQGGGLLEQLNALVAAKQCG
ncbi:SPFH domain-containing protein [Azotosporobacter soli]|uniref:SPFH domain-containing protein n=1 Tax=Azotosporobacter soli TaxID=3055040 RepID=UPI0031FE4643